MKFWVALIILLSSFGAHAFDGIVFRDETRNGFGVQGGSFLPFGIVGVRDKYPLWGVWYSHPGSIATVEYMFSTFNAKEVSFYHASAGFRIDFFAFEALLGYLRLGVDVNHYRRKPTRRTTFDYRTVPGGHSGFGVVFPFTDELALRGDFKFTFNPGAVMQVGLGLAYFFEGGASEAGATAGL